MGFLPSMDLLHEATTDHGQIIIPKKKSRRELVRALFNRIQSRPPGGRKMTYFMNIKNHP